MWYSSMELWEAFERFISHEKDRTPESTLIFFFSPDEFNLHDLLPSHLKKKIVTPAITQKKIVKHAEVSKGLQ